MVVTDYYSHRIVEFDQNMQFVKAFGSYGKGNGQLKYPRGIAADADDNIVVADLSNHCLQIFSKDEDWKKTIRKQGSDVGEFDIPWDVSVCKTSGKIFVSDVYNNRV
jgi:DNA-binding beta-propeller fold protein YncE